MKTIIQKYLANQFIWSFFISTSFLIFFLLTFQSLRLINVLMSKDIEVLLLLKLIGEMAISFIPLAFPLSILFSVIYTMNKFCLDSEYIIMRSVGLSRIQVLSPFLILTFFISMAILGFNFTLIPQAKNNFKNTIISISSQKLFTNLNAGEFFLDIPNIALYAERIFDKGKKLENVLIQLNEKGTEKIIWADNAYFDKNLSITSEVSFLNITLENGGIIETSAKGGDIKKILFGTYDFSLFNKILQGRFITKDSMRTSRELYDILYKRDTSNRSEKQLARTKIEFWNRVNVPIVCLLFVFVGFIISIKSTRGKSRNTGLNTLFFLCCYYALFFGGVGLAKSVKVPAALAIFLPTFLGLTFAFYLYKKTEWEI